VTTEPEPGAPTSSPADYSPVSGSATPMSPADSESTADMLRSMLSRAVEDQLVDQHEIAGAMGDIRAQLMRVGQEIADLRVHQPRDESSDAQINSVTVEMREAVRFLSERIDGVTRMVAQRGEDLADIRGALTAVDAHLRSQAETIGMLSAGLQSLPSYGEQVSSLQDNVAIVHRQLVGIEGAITAAADRPGDVRLTSIETSMVALGAQFGEVTDVSAAQAASVSEVQGTLSEVQRTMAELQGTLVALQGRIEPLASDITSIGGNVAGLLEGTADGAALDSRVRESVSAAMRATEQRMIAHVDEAVLALAQTLLKRRPVSIANPVGDVAAVEPSPSDGVVADAEVDSDVSRFDQVVPTGSDTGFEDIDLDDADRQMLAAVDFASVTPTAEPADEPVEEAGWVPAVAPPEVPVLQSDADQLQWRAEESGYVDPAVDEVPTPEPVASRYDFAGGDDQADQPIESSPIESTATEEWASDGVLLSDPPELDADADHAIDDAPAPTWPSQLPPDGVPADGTVVPDEVPETKRRWFRSS
jgi:hypothetical protein